MRHGGGRRCEHPEHDYLRNNPNAIELVPYAGFKNDEGKYLCWQHFYSGVNPCRAIRREKLFLGHLLCILPQLLDMSHEAFQHYYLGNDFNVRSCSLQRRPDMLFNFPKCAVLFEFDEKGHSDREELSEISHLMVIQQWCRETLGKDRIYVVRINPDGRHPMFRKKCNGPPTGIDMDGYRRELVWEPTEHFMTKMEVIQSALREIVHSAIHSGPRLNVFDDEETMYGLYVDKFFY